MVRSRGIQRRPDGVAPTTTRGGVRARWSVTVCPRLDRTAPSTGPLRAPSRSVLASRRARGPDTGTVVSRYFISASYTSYCFEADVLAGDSLRETVTINEHYLRSPSVCVRRDPEDPGDVDRHDGPRSGPGTRPQVSDACPKVVITSEYLTGGPPVSPERAWRVPLRSYPYRRPRGRPVPPGRSPRWGHPCRRSDSNRPVRRRRVRYP